MTRVEVPSENEPSSEPLMVNKEPFINTALDRVRYRVRQWGVALGHLLIGGAIGLSGGLAIFSVTYTINNAINKIMIGGADINLEVALPTLGVSTLVGAGLVGFQEIKNWRELKK